MSNMISMPQETVNRNGVQRRAWSAAMVGVSLLVSAPFVPSAAKAAVISTSTLPNGGFVCIDNAGAGSPGVPTTQHLTTYACHAGINQQFEFSGTTLYTAGGQRCVDVNSAGTAPGTPVDTTTCNGSVAQQWEYLGGLLYNPYSSKCLDGVSLANGAQVIISYCNSASASQLWEIK